MGNRLTLGIAGAAAVLILILAGVLLFVVGGDGGGDDGNGTPSAGRTSEPGDNGDNGNDPPAGSGELRIRGDDPLTLDPATAQDAGSAAYIVEIFSGLVRLDNDLKVQPDVAERWETSDDGKVYTFFLNPKATFQDGRPVTADDVKYSIERALNPDTGSIVAENFLGDIVGARDMARSRADSVSGVRVVNDSTVEITLDAPKQYFLYKLTYPTAFLVDRRQVESNPRRWTQKPNGTGPFKLKSWKLGEELILEAYAKHHLGAPKLNTVRFGLSGGSGLVAYQDGEIDITGVGLDDLQRIQDPGDELNDEYVQLPRQSIDYIGFNTNVPPFDDVKVRQAFALAINRQQIAEVILRSAVPVASGILPPGIPGFSPDDKTYPFDPERARQLLSESKYAGNMPEITLAETGAGATVGPTTEAIIQFWKEELDIDVQIEQAESATFFNDLDQGRYQMFHLGWILDYPDPEDVLDVLFYSRSRQNSSRFSNADIDAKLEQARTETDTERRLSIYREVEKQLVSDAVWIPMFFDVTHALVKPYVKNFKFPPLVIERYREVEVNR